MLAVCVVAYAFSPIDLIPDFVPVLGYLDDLLLVPLGIALALKLIPAEIIADARQRAALRLAESRPTSAIAAVAIVMIWLGLAALCAWIVYRAAFA
jgi:uncharacterized membrane protein YkvA (DUF1232 family)